MKKSLPERTELGERRHLTAQNDAVPCERRLVHAHACRLEHRLELLAHDVVRPSDEGRFAIVRFEQATRLLFAPPRDPPRDEPPRMRVLERQHIDGIEWCRQAQRLTLAIESAQHRICQLARTEPVSALRQLHGLRNCRVCRHAPHRQKLKRAEPEQVEQIGIEPCDPAAHALAQERVDPRPLAQHAVDELARPAAISGIEMKLLSNTPIEGEVEQLAGAEVGAHGRRRRARVGDAARASRRPLAGIRVRRSSAADCRAVILVPPPSHRRKDSRALRARHSPRTRFRESLRHRARRAERAARCAAARFRQWR